MLDEFWTAVSLLPERYEQLLQAERDLQELRTDVQAASALWRSFLKPIPPRTCGECENIYTPVLHRQRYCSKPCRMRARDRRRRFRSQEAHRADNISRWTHGPIADVIAEIGSSSPTRRRAPRAPVVGE